MFFTKKLVIIIAVLALAIGSSVYFYFSRDTGPKFEFAVVGLRDVTREVSVTGRVKPVESVELAFERTGRVQNVYSRVGDEVRAGQTLVKLDDSELLAGLSQSEADVKSKKAKLDELNRGTRPEELRLKELAVYNAEISLEDAKKNLADKMQDA